MTWYRDAEAELTLVASAIQSQRTIELDRLEAIAMALVASLKRSDELIVMALSSPSGSPLLTNLLNVAVVSTKVGMGLGYYGRELERLALAGLLHDIGLFAVPQSLVTKAGRLSADERTLIEQHPELGYEAIKRSGAGYAWLAELIRQAHERTNGLGYPNRLKGRQISEMALIIGVSDVFDALISERPYRPRLFPHEAIKELLVAERATFPREITKALVEQLSVYPLGTTVQLTTGETGTVVSVNVRYPLRPIVEVDESGDAGNAENRHIDLSLTPLVSIIEALKAPVVGRLTFAPEIPNAEVPMGAASDQFTSLLESLDAIATAIQGVVEHARHPGAADGAKSEAILSHESGAETLSPEDVGFDKEVVGLFALEAHEWLAQIQSALARLSAGKEGPVRSHVYGIVLNGITNLARSAATVHLDEIESMATNLLPTLRDVGGAETAVATESLRHLHQGLGRVIAAVRQLAAIPSQSIAGDEQTGTDEEVSVVDEEVNAVESAEMATASLHSNDSEPEWSSLPSLPLLSALRELQKARSRSMQPARDMLEAVIHHAEAVGEGEQPVDVSTIERILRDLDRQDSEFLQAVHSHVPQMTEALASLRAQAASFVTASQLDPILGHVEFLHDQAKVVQAMTIMMFLQGLKSFLTVTAYRKVTSLPIRLEALELRLKTLVPMAEQWVNLGRLERATIEEILPA
ncbi:HD-GYP domain-containing protein [Nitrospira lenta]|nr:HD domain-containing phosphohydrolase [Nitrospira lenta]